MEENLAPDISNESRLGYISNNRAENMPRSRIVEFDLAGKTEEIGELYFGGPLRNLSTSKRHEENISIRLAEKLEEDFDMCVVNFGSGDELPYTGLACDRERRVLFTGALEEIEEKGNSQQAEARGNLIAIEKSLLSKHTQYDEILRVLQCDSPSDELCGNNTECFECIFNKELFELNVGKDRKIEKASSNWQNKVKIILFEETSQLPAKIDQFVGELFPPHEQDILKQLDRVAELKALKTITIYSDGETKVEIPDTNLLTLISPSFPRIIEVQERNRNAVCEQRVFLPATNAPASNFSSAFRLSINQLISSLMRINSDDCLGQCLVRQPMLFESEDSTLRNVFWAQTPIQGIAPYTLTTLFSNRYSTGSEDFYDRDDISDFAKHLRVFDNAVTKGLGLGDLRNFWEYEINNNRKSIQAFFAFAHFIDPDNVPLIPIDTRHDFRKKSITVPSFVRCTPGEKFPELEFSCRNAFGSSKISDSIREQFPGIDIDEIHSIIKYLLGKVTSEQCRKFVETIEGPEYSGFKFTEYWSKVINRDNCLEYFNFLKRSNTISYEIYCITSSKFLHTDDDEINRVGSTISQIKARIYLPKLCELYNKFVLIVNDSIETDSASKLPSPKWLERYYLIAKEV